MLCRIFHLEIHGFAINLGIVVFLVYGKTDKGIGFFKVEHKEGRRFVHNGCLISIQLGYGIFIAKFRCAQASLIEGITIRRGITENHIVHRQDSLCRIICKLGISQNVKGIAAEEVTIGQIGGSALLAHGKVPRELHVSHMYVGGTRSSGLIEKGRNRNLISSAVVKVGQPGSIGCNRDFLTGNRPVQCESSRTCGFPSWQHLAYLGIYHAESGFPSLDFLLTRNESESRYKA